MQGTKDRSINMACASVNSLFDHLKYFPFSFYLKYVSLTRLEMCLVISIFFLRSIILGLNLFCLKNEFLKFTETSCVVIVHCK
jgi:hypothetical protein